MAEYAAQARDATLQLGGAVLRPLRRKVTMRSGTVNATDKAPTALKEQGTAEAIGGGTDGIAGKLAAGQSHNNKSSSKPTATTADAATARAAVNKQQPQRTQQLQE